MSSPTPLSIEQLENRRVLVTVEPQHLSDPPDLATQLHHSIDRTGFHRYHFYYDLSQLETIPPRVADTLYSMQRRIRGYGDKLTVIGANDAIRGILAEASRNRLDVAGPKLTADTIRTMPASAPSIDQIAGGQQAAIEIHAAPEGGAIFIATFRHGPIDEDSAPAIAAAFKDFGDGKSPGVPRTLVLDFTGVTSIGSAAWLKILALSLNCKRAGDTLEVTGMAPDVTNSMTSTTRRMLTPNASNGVAGGMGGLY